MERSPAHHNQQNSSHLEPPCGKKDIMQEQTGFARIPLKPDGVIPRMTLSYLNKIVNAGNEKKYTEDMLYQVEPHFTYRGGETKLRKVLELSSGKMTWKTLFLFSFGLTSKLCILDTLDNILSLVVAFVTSKLIIWIQKPNPNFSDGAVLTSLVVLCSFAKVFIYNWHTMYFYEIEKYVTNGLRVRSTS